ncbi:ParA family protein [Flavobacterium daejeonense]|uniref:ParA family protein n=1 Tax=Flavobacterium daejeonense TaxID=350893 RepID=UPI00054F7EF3|nr:ParA family protein [Flavobacterium daejeonense]
MKIISILNHKGGTGKTTSTANIGAGLARLNKKTLLIDIDPQANLTEGLGLINTEKSIYDSIKDDKYKTPLPIVEISEFLHLVPSSLDLLGAELELVSRSKRESILEKLIHGININYDYIIIDCPPAMGLLTLNALVPSTTVLVPLEAEFYAYKGIDRLINIIENVQFNFNPELAIGGVFITKCNSQRILTDSIKTSVKKYFGEKLFDTSIRVNVALAEAPVSGQNIFDYSPTSNGAIDYGNLVDEILMKI